MLLSTARHDPQQARHEGCCRRKTSIVDPHLDGIDLDGRKGIRVTETQKYAPPSRLPTKLLQHEVHHPQAHSDFDLDKTYGLRPGRGPAPAGGDPGGIGTQVGQWPR